MQTFIYIIYPYCAAIDTVTVYVFHEPSLLSSLQDNGLTGVVMKSLVLKDVSSIALYESIQSHTIFKCP